MARNYKRDQKGRFSSTGGGGKLGKSAKNIAARTKYKEAASKLRETEKIFGGKSSAFAKRSIAGAKSGLTRVTKNLHGGTKGNVGRNTADTMSSARQSLAGMFKTSRARKLGSAQNAPAPASRRTDKPKAKAKPKPAVKPKATAKPKAVAKPKTPRGLDGPQRRTKASKIAVADANARLDAGRRLRGAGKNPTARAERNLERGMTGSGRKARKTEATAKRAIDFMASQGTLGKRGKRRS